MFRWTLCSGDSHQYSGGGHQVVDGGKDTTCWVGSTEIVCYLLLLLLFIDLKILQHICYLTEGLLQAWK